LQTQKKSSKLFATQNAVERKWIRSKCHCRRTIIGIWGSRHAYGTSTVGDETTSVECRGENEIYFYWNYMLNHFYYNYCKSWWLPMMKRCNIWRGVFISLEIETIIFCDKRTQKLAIKCLNAITEKHKISIFKIKTHRKFFVISELRFI
jgi:hypothetical protein